MEETNTTKVVQRPDGSEVLQLRKATLTAVAGPHKGEIFSLEQPVTRIGSGSECDICLSDATVSRLHAEIVATEQGYRVRDLDSTNGTLIGGVTVIEALIQDVALLALGDTQLQLSALDDTVTFPLSARVSFGGLLGTSVEMRRIFAVLERVAEASTTVLFEGESGTGKELAAHAVHAHSARSEGPFIVVDCGAIPANLIESELFGHERGAFTGASATREGALVAAEGGTVFLDEIGELPLEHQPKLLRFLEGKQVKPVGATRHRPVDVRVVAATNRPLRAMVHEGGFREDLYYRLAVVRVELPPLRRRVQDVRLLAHHFAQQQCEDSHEVITPDVERLLLSHSWPGNVRELRHIVEQLLLVPELAKRTLRGHAQMSSDPNIGPLLDLPFHEGRRRWQEIFDRGYLAERIARAGGVVTHAAEQAELPRQTFHRLLRKYGLSDRS